MDNVISIGIWRRLKRDRDIGRKAVLSDVKTAFTFTPALKLNLRVFLAGDIVAMVIYCTTKVTATFPPMIRQFVDTIILASTGIEWL